MPRVRFTTTAKADLDNAIAWYAAHAPHVVPRFQETVRAMVERL